LISAIFKGVSAQDASMSKSKTGKLRAVQLLLGHKKLASTVQGWRCSSKRRKLAKAKVGPVAVARGYRPEILVSARSGHFSVSGDVEN
jgi:hypothetical protein